MYNVHENSTLHDNGRLEKIDQTEFLDIRQIIWQLPD